MSLLHLGLSLVLAPLLVGVANRIKSFFAGRTGPPILQLYWDLGKLLRKGAVYSRTTTWLFRGGPLVGLAALLGGVLLVPWGSAPALISFEGDLVLFAYFLGLARFATALAALDTGSSFEGMGASREVQFAALAEPALFLGLATLARQTGQLSLTRIYSALGTGAWERAAPSLALVAAALLVVFLAENARVPVDDPNTHLELTMIHEVMVLDHGGPDLGIILYGAALKLWILGALLVGLMLPTHSGHFWLDEALFLGGLGGLAILVGAIESAMARLRLNKVPHLLVGAGTLAALSLAFALR
jgi:formate hydrogenlyase subunit 4